MIEEEVIDVVLLPFWLKVNAKVKIKGGRHNGYHGYVKSVSVGEYGNSKVKVNVPSVGTYDYLLGRLTHWPKE